ncbi:MAG: hypothetical protein EPO35_04445 [Acidobacteria bacterium]|nr:MAG: hypothetical protein EPO35_04445 [Acidobacteriota bacterium]
MKLRQLTAGVVALLLLAMSSVAARGPEGPRLRTEQGASLPARLSDADFWKLSTDLSEPAGYFQSDNFVGNELSFQWVIPELKKNVKPGGVYLGVGPDQNFTYIAALQPSMAFIVDIRRGNFLQLLMYKALIELSADRAEFAAKLFARNKPANIRENASADAVLSAVYNMPASRELYEKNLKAITEHLTRTHGFALTANELRDLEYIYGSFFSYGPGIAYSNGNNRGGTIYPTYWDMQVTDDNAGKTWAYMGTEENFRAIKRMEEANLIVPVTGNFGGPKALKAVGAWIRERGGTVTTFYTSNVEQYLFQDNIWREYYNNVASMPTDSTSQFIRSVFNGNGGFGGGGGLRSAQLTCSIAQLLSAFKDGKINSYYDVIALSR